jgi:putative transcriptional regulator
MEKELFNQLLESVKEASEINKGLKKPSRTFTYSPLDVKAIRNKLHYSQTKFAMLIGVSPRTLQNWEQGRRQPVGPAQVLLRVASKNPKAVQKALTSV